MALASWPADAPELDPQHRSASRHDAAWQRLTNQCCCLCLSASYWRADGAPASTTTSASQRRRRASVSRHRSRRLLGDRRGSPPHGSPAAQPTAAGPQAFELGAPWNYRGVSSGPSVARQHHADHCRPHRPFRTTCACAGAAPTTARAASLLVRQRAALRRRQTSSATGDAQVSTRGARADFAIPN